MSISELRCRRELQEHYLGAPAEVAYHIRINSQDRYRRKEQQMRCRGAMEEDEDKN